MTFGPKKIFREKRAGVKKKLSSKFEKRAGVKKKQSRKYEKRAGPDYYISF